MKNIILAALVLAGSSALAVGGESRASIKPEKKYGAFVAIGNPYPTLIGINGAYNIDNNWRASVGYGQVKVSTFVQEMTATTYSAGVDYLFTDWTIRPLVGAKAGYFSVSGDGIFEIQGLNKSTGLFYTTAGLDYLSSGGFNLGTGLNIALLGGQGVNFFANIGYYF